MLGLNPRFHVTLVRLLELGYKCRVRLPLFISAGFFLCHLFSSYVPRVEINVQVVEEPDDEAEFIDEDEDAPMEAHAEVVIEGAIVE